MCSCSTKTKPNKIQTLKVERIFFEYGKYPTSEKYKLFFGFIEMK